ncbi:MAG: DUF1540 domain-containing protein [Bacillota bacterium]
MSQHIHCAVNNCHYWTQGNKCAANEILVVSDQFGHSQPDSVDATQAASIPATSAQTCMETCCKTFVPKGSNKTHLDSVTKQSSTQSSAWHNPTH